MGEINDWLWLVQTDKGNFFMTVAGEWSQAEALKKVWQLFTMLKIDITGLFPRQRATGSVDNTGTIFQTDDPKNALGYEFLAAKRFWALGNRMAEFEAEMLLLKKQTEK
jgi:hypothetical protein